MNDNAVPTRSSQVTSRVIEGEAIIIKPDGGEIRMLNEVGTRVWELINGENSVKEIAGTIYDEYKVTGEKAITDVKVFLLELDEHKVIELHDADVPEKKS